MLAVHMCIPKQNHHQQHLQLDFPKFMNASAPMVGCHLVCGAAQALFDRYKDCPDQFAMGKEQSKQTKRRKARAAADADDATQRVALQPVVLQPQYMPPGIMYTQPHGGQPGAHMVAPPPPPPGHMMSQEHMLPPQCVPMAPPAVPDHSAPPQHAMVYVPHQRPPAQSVMDMSDVDNIDWLLDGLDNLADDIPMANNGASCGRV